MVRPEKSLMELVQSFIRDYGIAVYAILFAYCALKSGSLPLFAGFAAQTGNLDLATVSAATFMGGYLGDEARFWISRRFGNGIFEKYPRINRLVETGKHLLERFGSAYIFLYRYPKGMRTIGALPLGLTSIRWRTFTFLNAASAAVWTILLVGVGYLFGSAIEQAVASNWGFYSVLALVLFVGMTLFAWRYAMRIQT
jgi:membrane protein DedA with SNARE-associated domain